MAKKVDLTASRLAHDTLAKGLAHHHDALSDLDRQISQLQQQKAIVKIAAATELGRQHAEAHQGLAVSNEALHSAVALCW